MGHHPNPAGAFPHNPPIPRPSGQRPAVDISFSSSHTSESTLSSSLPSSLHPWSFHSPSTDPSSAYMLHQTLPVSHLPCDTPDHHSSMHSLSEDWNNVFPHPLNSTVLATLAAQGIFPTSHASSAGVNSDPHRYITPNTRLPSIKTQSSNPSSVDSHSASWSIPSSLPSTSYHSSRPTFQRFQPPVSAPSLDKPSMSADEILPSAIKPQDLGLSRPHKVMDARRVTVSRGYRLNAHPSSFPSPSGL